MDEPFSCVLLDILTEGQEFKLQDCIDLAIQHIDPGLQIYPTVTVLVWGQWVCIFLLEDVNEVLVFSGDLEGLPFALISGCAGHDMPASFC